MASILCVALLAPVLVAAVNYDGFEETKVDLHDAGIWVVNQGLSKVGRLNTQIGEIEVAVGLPTEASDVEQVDDTVLLTDPDQTAVVDVALAAAREPRPLPADAAVGLGGSTGVVVAAGSGNAWIADRDRIANVDFEEAEPDASFGEDAQVAVGTDGKVHSYSAATGEIRTEDPDGPGSNTVIDSEVDAPSITAVGSRPVLLDGDAAVLYLPGGRAVDLSGFDDAPVLQHSGPVNSSVVVATDSEVLAVPLGGGDPVVLDESGTGGAIAPVWLDGCAYSAWSATPRYAQLCDGEDVLAADIEQMLPGAALRFRVNRDRVVLNDLASGKNLLFTDDEPIPVDDWTQVHDPEDDKDDQEENIEIEKKELDCEADVDKAELEDDDVATRPDRPVIVKVLTNDHIPLCDVPIVKITNAPVEAVGVASVVAGGTAIQVTPTTGSGATIQLEYVVTTPDGDTEAADVSVEVRSFETSNRPPEPVVDETVVEAGREVRHDVLANDIDPDGDALTLVSITAERPGGSVTYRADGQVTYHSGGTEAGERRFTYLVQDELGEPAEGELVVTVQPEGNLQPVAKYDQVTTYVGSDVTVDLLANDSDPNDDELQVTAVEEAEDLTIDWTSDGRLTVSAAEPMAPRVFGYTITDGEETADGRVRVDVVEPVENHAPVAVRDDLVVRPGVAAVVDLVSNDVDPDGDLLAVAAVDVSSDDAAGLSVELLDMHLARVTASAGFDRSVALPYTVSDGVDSSQGVLVVRPFLQAGVDQPPVVEDDEVTVRAGNATGIPVLENDADPEGELLELSAVEEMGDGDGVLFVQGDELRYVAPATGPDTIRANYTVVDPGGNRADGLVTLRILPAEGDDNSPPRPARLEARVVDGGTVTVPVPLVGLDPDGDTLALLGVADPPASGHARRTPSGFVYAADNGATGNDSFTFLVRDPDGLEAEGRVDVVILPRPSANTPPVAVPDKAEVEEGDSVEIPLLANDTDQDGDPIELLTEGKDKWTEPQSGSIELHPDGNRLMFDAPGGVDEATEVTFTYGVTDGRGGSARSVVTVAVLPSKPENARPVARDDFVEPQLPGATVEVDVLDNDIDPDAGPQPLTVTVPDFDGATVNADGAIAVAVGERSQAFYYTVDDGGSDSDGEPNGQASALVVIPVAGSLPPTCDHRTVEVEAGESVTVDVVDACSDPAGKSLELLQLLEPRHGSVELDGQKAVFTADPEVMGEAGFAYQVTNGDETAIGGVTVAVTGQNFPPEFAGTLVELPAGGEREVDLAALVSDLNPDDDHTFSLDGGTTDKISASVSGTTLDISADDNARDATTALELMVSDGPNEVAGTVDVRVLKHDGAPPVAVNDSLRVLQEESDDLDLTSNDVDPLGKGLIATIQSAGQLGTATMESDSTMTYTPGAGQFGTDIVTYSVVEDGVDDPERTSRAQVSIDVIGRPAAPGAPTGIAESHTVRLEWGAPAANGAPITHYVVEDDRDGISQECPSTSCVIDGLSNGETYRFRVAAVNEAILEDADLVFSGWSTAMVPDQRPDTPAAPALVFGDGEIDVSWTAPLVDGTPISNYRLRISGADVNTEQDVGNVTQYTWTGLTNGVSYSFSVAAENDADPGLSEFSSPSNDPINSIPAGVPGPVPVTWAGRPSTNDAAVGGLLEVRWDNEPTLNTNGADVEEFEMIATPSGPGQPWVIADGNATSTQVSGLNNGTSYTFQVRAKNKAGWGAYGSSPPATPAKQPDQMAAPTIAPRNNAVQVTFALPGTGGEPIDRVQYSTNGSTWHDLGNLSSPQNAGVGINNGNSYTVQLRACNIVGCGDSSPASGSATPFGSPSVSVSRSGQTLTWSWSEQAGVNNYTVARSGFTGGSKSGCCSFSRNFGFGPSRTFGLTVTANGPGGHSQSSGQVRGTVPDSRSISLSEGSPGSDNLGQGCGPGAGCVWFHIVTAGFPAGTYTVSCRVGGSQFFTDTISVPSSGVVNGDIECLAGTGLPFTVEIDGVTSNVLLRS